MKISIVIPAFNAEKYIVETLDSIRKQTVQPYEVVVVNDCSSDGTKALLEKYSQGYPIKIVKNQVNMGIGATRQKGAEYAQGDYVAFLSADDCYHARFIEKCLPFLDGQTATYTAYWQCNSKLVPHAIFSPPNFSRENIIEWALQKNMYVNFSSIIVPKSIFGKVKFESELRHGEDLIFLLDTVLAGLEWKLVSAPLLFYRMHSQAGTYTQKPSEFHLLWNYLEDRLQKFNVEKKVIWESYRVSYRRAFPGVVHRVASKLYHSVFL